MGRFYSVPFSGVAVSAAVDSFQLVVPAQASGGKPIRIQEIIIGQASDYGDTAAEGLSVLVKRASGVYTAGSGGTSVTPVPHDSNTSAAAFTASTNNTTQAAAGSGSLTTVRGDALNVQSGWAYQPIPSQALQFNPGEACVVSITVPADALTMSGTIVVEELN